VRRVTTGSRETRNGGNCVGNTAGDDRGPGPTVAVRGIYNWQDLGNPPCRSPHFPSRRGRRGYLPAQREADSRYQFSAKQAVDVRRGGAAYMMAW